MKSSDSVKPYLYAIGMLALHMIVSYSALRLLSEITLENAIRDNAVLMAVIFIAYSLLWLSLFLVLAFKLPHTATQIYFALLAVAAFAALFSRPVLGDIQSFVAMSPMLCMFTLLSSSDYFIISKLVLVMLYVGFFTLTSASKKIAPIKTGKT